MHLYYLIGLVFLITGTVLTAPMDNTDVSSDDKVKDTSSATKDKDMSSATKDQDMSSATKDKDVPSATKDQDMSSATKVKDMSSATEDKDMSSATKDKDMSSATKDKDMSSATKDQDLSSATKDKDMSSASKGSLDTFSDSDKYEADPFIKKNSEFFSTDKDIKELSSSKKEENVGKLPPLNDDSSPSAVNNKNDAMLGVKDQNKAPSSVQENIKADITPGIAVNLDDAKLDNNIVDNKEKEKVVTADDSVSASKDAKFILPYTLDAKPTTPQVLGNFIFEMLKTPIYLLRAFKEMIGGLLGIRKPIATATASAPY